MELRLIYNLRSEHPGKKDGAPFDVDADWDIPDTIYQIKKTLQEVGFNVIDICCDHEIVTKLAVSDSLVFSICEMVGGAYREALIPSLCQILGIPYVFSSPDVMVKTLDKNLCNLVVQQSKVSVPDWLYIQSIENAEALACLNQYPYIVKPAFEGSGMGISDQSVSYSYTELVNRVDYTISAYKQPILVQRYIDGIELTVGILGEGTTIEVLAPIVVHLPCSKVYGYEQKENASTQASYSLSTNDLINKEMIAVSKKIYQVLGCRDAARIDFRFDTTSDTLYFIEVNPLPHLHPDIGDFCRSAYGAGYSYETLLKKICNHAIHRSSH